MFYSKLIQNAIKSSFKPGINLLINPIFIRYSTIPPLIGFKAYGPLYPDPIPDEDDEDEEEKKANNICYNKSESNCNKNNFGEDKENGQKNKYFVNNIIDRLNIEDPKEKEVYKRIIGDCLDKIQTEEEQDKYSKSWTYLFMSLFGCASNYLFGALGIGSPFAIPMSIVGGFLSLQRDFSYQLLGAIGNWIIMIAFSYFGY